MEGADTGGEAGAGHGAEDKKLEWGLGDKTERDIYSSHQRKTTTHRVTASREKTSSVNQGIGHLVNQSCNKGLSSSWSGQPAGVPLAVQWAAENRVSNHTSSIPHPLPPGTQVSPHPTSSLGMIP